MIELTEVEKARTPLAEMFLENLELCLAMDALRQLVEKTYPDCGDDLDAMCIIRDAAIFGVAKIREQHMNQANIEGQEAL